MRRVVLCRLKAGQESSLPIIELRQSVGQGRFTCVCGGEVGQ